MKSITKIEQSSHLEPIGPGRAFRRILVPTDFSPRSERAVNYGVDLARQLRTHLTLLHVVPAPFAIDYTLGGIPGAEWEEVRNRADKKLDVALKRAKLRHEPVEALVRVGSDLHQEIVSATREVDASLVVLSTHRYKGWKFLLFGSDAEELLLEIPCPVLIVH
jgi:nucleotide-binding universal stress UspA family protein